MSGTVSTGRGSKANKRQQLDIFLSKEASIRRCCVWFRINWQGQQGSNPRPTVLETVALPAELYPCGAGGICDGKIKIKTSFAHHPNGKNKKGRPVGAAFWRVRILSALPLHSKAHLLVRPDRHHSVILDTTPAPTVRPPSRIAKRRPCSIAIGAISSTPKDTLSPGITISVPSAS